MLDKKQCWLRKTCTTLGPYHGILILSRVCCPGAMWQLACNAIEVDIYQCWGFRIMHEPRWTHRPRHMLGPAQDGVTRASLHSMVRLMDDAVEGLARGRRCKTRAIFRNLTARGRAKFLRAHEFHALHRIPDEPRAALERCACWHLWGTAAQAAHCA